MKIKNSLIRIFPIILLGSTIFTGCNETPYTPSIWRFPELTEILETQNFIFHYSVQDQVDSIRQEVFHEWAVTQLGIIIPKKIDYYKYLNRAHMQQLTGRSTNGWADPLNFAVHSIWSWDNHECVHCYTSLIGRPSDFFNEGIAVAFSTDPYNGDYEARWWGYSIHYWAKKYKDEGTLIPLNSILETYSFRSYSDGITYPESGSFVRFLIDNYSLSMMMSFFQIGNREDPIEEIKQNFQSIYGFSIDQAEQEWLMFLDNY